MPHCFTATIALSPLETPVLRKLLNQPRRVWQLMFLAIVVMLAFGLYLQHVVGLEPCPMCIVQRYVYVLMAFVALLGAGFGGRKSSLVAGSWLVVLGAGGAYVAARQSWLQWYPPEFASCGRDFYGMIETFPLQRAIPMIFRGSGDCTKVDWTFLGGSIANWSFVCFTAFALLALLTVIQVVRHPEDEELAQGDEVGDEAAAKPEQDDKFLGV
jgi:disulfide bond formation protein DsbB